MKNTAITAPGKLDSRNDHFTSIAKRVQAEFIRLAAWLAMAGSSIC